MELTEKDYAEAFGVELPEEPAEPTEPEGAGGTEPQEGAPDDGAGVEGGDNGGEGGSSEGEPQEGAQEASGQPQSMEERRRQAHGRRQRELEAQRQAARDNAYEEMFRGQVNPYTNEPIRTEADWRAYRDAMTRQGAEAGLRKSGVDPQLVRDIMAAELRPLREEAQRRELSAISEQARMVSAQADTAIRQAVDNIRQLYGGDAQSVEDIVAMPTGKAFSDYVGKGLSLEDAYYLANREAIDKQRLTAAKQAGVNQARGKGHMANPAPAAGPAGYQATPEEAAAYREFDPDATDKEINAAYGKYHKNQ